VPRARRRPRVLRLKEIVQSVVDKPCDVMPDNVVPFPAQAKGATS
jgi:hypothetical protein